MASKTASSAATAAAFRSVKSRNIVRENIFLVESIATVVVFAYFTLDAAVSLRTMLSVAFALIYYSRLNIMARFLLPRALAIEEITFVMLVWLPAILGTYGYASVNSGEVSTGIAVAAVSLFAVGSFFNSFSEYQRKVWKDRPENKGKLYTEGLAAWSRNINYFGDVLLFAGWAVLSGAWWALWVPAAMTANFCLYAIPEKEAYLRDHYAKEWPAYQASTKALVPFVY